MEWNIVYVQNDFESRKVVTKMGDSNSDSDDSELVVVMKIDFRMLMFISEGVFTLEDYPCLFIRVGFSFFKNFNLKAG